MVLEFVCWPVEGCGEPVAAVVVAAAANLAVVKLSKLDEILAGCCCCWLAWRVFCGNWTTRFTDPLFAGCCCCLESAVVRFVAGWLPLGLFLSLDHEADGFTTAAGGLVARKEGKRKSFELHVDDSCCCWPLLSLAPDVWPPSSGSRPVADTTNPSSCPSSSGGWPSLEACCCLLSTG